MDCMDDAFLWKNVSCVAVCWSAVGQLLREVLRVWECVWECVAVCWSWVWECVALCWLELVVGVCRCLSCTTHVVAGCGSVAGLSWSVAGRSRSVSGSVLQCVGRGSESVLRCVCCRLLSLSVAHGLRVLLRVAGLLWVCRRQV